MLWDFPIQTAKQLENKLPDITVVEKITGKSLMIDPLRPFDTQVEKKDEKQQIQRVEARGWVIVEVKVEGSNNCY